MSQPNLLQACVQPLGFYANERWINTGWLAHYGFRRILFDNEAAARAYAEWHNAYLERADNVKT